MMRPAIILAIAVLDVFAAVGSGAAEVSDGAWPDQRKQTFRAVWSTVNEAYFDETFGGVDWRGVGERYSNQLADVADNRALRRLLQAMLGELGQSHFAILPREAVVFKPSERQRVGTTGVEVSYLDGAVVIDRIRPGSAADRAGFRVGTKIRKVGGLDLGAVAETMREMGVGKEEMGRHLSALVLGRLSAGAGMEVAIEGDTPESGGIAARVTTEMHEGAWSEPFGNFPSMPLECEARRDEDGTAWLKFNAFSPGLMKQIRAFLRGLQKDDALILDLRGNPGGVTEMASGIAGLLVERELVLGTMRLRKGAMSFVAYPQERAFLGPIAVLIDGQSASTSEILAAGLRDHGRARLFGERTAGAALPSAFRELPTGDLLQYAIGDVRTPRKAMIEGKGVEPDEIVRRTLADVREQRDEVAAAAKAWLAKERESRRESPKPARDKE